MYARAVAGIGRALAVRIGAVATISAVLAGCALGSPQERRVDLCGDLAHLGDTIALLVRPPAEARVGEVRGSLDKLDPTLEAIEDAADLVPENVTDAVRDAQDAYREAIEGIGDDHFLAEEDVPVAEAQGDLEEAVRGVEAELACESSATMSPS